jgi:hypothetical protein
MSIGINIPFFEVLVTIEPGRSSLTVRYQELFDNFVLTLRIDAPLFNSGPGVGSPLQQGWALSWLLVPVKEIQQLKRRTDALCVSN